MKTKKSKRARWFNLVVGGIAFMVLACSIAEARKHVTEYQANPSGYVVAVNHQNNKTMLIQKIKDVAQQERQKLAQKHKFKLESIGPHYKFKASMKNVGGTVMLITTLLKDGKTIESTTQPIQQPTRTFHGENGGTTRCGPNQPCPQGAYCISHALDTPSPSGLCVPDN